MKRKKVSRILLILLRDLLFLSLLGNILALFIYPWEFWSMKIVLTNCMFSIGIGYPAMKGMEWITKFLEKRFPWLESPIKRLVYQVLALTLFSAAIIFLGFFLWNMVSGGYDFVTVLKNGLPSLKVVYTFIFLSLLVGNTILFFKNWKEAAVQQEELKRAHLALQFQSLKDQIRPHFLFNSLSSLTTLIHSDAEKAILFVHKLSDVYRYVLEQRDNELVPLKDDLKFLEDYIFLQKIRFGDNLKVENNVEPDKNRMVIPLSLQMLVENAIKHNEISREHPLLIEIHATGQNQVIVKNNLRRKELSETSLGMGLENLKKQIAFFSDDKLLVREEGGSFMVTIPTFSI
jgi:hypothetical protein